MAEEDDRRHEERAAIELKVEYHRLNTFFYDYTKNISKGGTFIKTTRPLDIGTIFLFKLFVPTFPEPLVLRGEVRWVLREGEPPPPEAPPDAVEAGMGIRFMYDDEHQRGQIDRLVEKMMVASLGQRIYARLRGDTE
jgi:type IV pilus assembly protein PilZ